MRQTRVPPKVTRSTKLQGTQHSPELAFRSTYFCAPEKLIFPVLYGMLTMQCSVYICNTLLLNVNLHQKLK